MNSRAVTRICGLLIVTFAGALFWAKERDPFSRVWFTVRVERDGGAKCVAVLPKTASRPLPVVVYLHGSVGGLLGDGNDLRQMAEMGLAAVAMDYCQTNDAVCEQQFAALLRHLQRQKWADTNAVAWIGFSLGAEKATRFWLKYPEARPQLLVRLGGGWVEELQKLGDGSWKPEGGVGADAVVNAEQRTPSGEHSTFDIQHPTSNGLKSSRVLLIHGDQDGVFPVADAERVAAAFRSNGAPVELKVLAGQSHGFNPSRGVVFRALGEFCLTRLRGAEALGQYRSIGVWQGAAWPLWVWWLPALAWGGGWVVWRKTRSNWAGRLRARTWAGWGGFAVRGRAERRKQKAESGKRGNNLLGGLARGAAVVLALGAAALTIVQLGVLRLAVSDGTLAVARRFLVQPQEREDFEYLSALSCWQGQRLRALLEHAHLARYNRGLVNWTLEDAVYREFVLSPMIAAGGTQDLRWRRVLWESLYPRVRKEQSIEAAAETVVRHLRERVTMAGGDDWPSDIADIWRRQITSPRGFHRLIVAGLRSVGIAARLDSKEQAEMFAGGKWQPAPRPLVERW